MDRGVTSSIHRRENGGDILLSNQLQRTAGITSLVGYSTVTNGGKSRHGSITRTTPSTDRPRTVSFSQPPLPAQDPSCQQGTQTGVRMGYEGGISQHGFPQSQPQGVVQLIYTPQLQREIAPRVGTQTQVPLSLQVGSTQRPPVADQYNQNASGQRTTVDSTIMSNPTSAVYLYSLNCRRGPVLHCPD